MEHSRPIVVADFRWHLAPASSGDEVERLLGPNGLRLAEWEAAGLVQLVKDTPHRRVHRIVLPGLDLHLKHYLGDGRARLRRLFRGSPARREFLLGQEVARRGVPTLEVLACGESHRVLGPTDSFLLTRTLPEASPLLDFLETGLTGLPRPLRAVLLQRLARGLGTFLARKHAAGVRHDDLHPGNLLVRFVRGDPELYLIDLPAVRVGRPLDWPASLGNLTMLDRWFALRFSRTDRRRAWRAYFQARPELALDERAAARELILGTQESLIHLGRQMDHRCLGGNRHFRAFTAKGVSGHAVVDLDREILARLSGSPDAPFQDPAARSLKCSDKSSVVELDLPFAVEKRTVICKRLRPGSWIRILASLFRLPPALHSYVTGHGFRLRGLPTPRPLAVWHRRRWGLFQEGYLLMDRVPEALSLREFVEQLNFRSTRERRARLWPVIDELARLIRTLHGWRMSHRDLKAPNILISPAGWAMAARGLRDLEPCPEHRRDRVWFIDLVGVRHHRRLPRFRQVRDLARLHVSFLEHPGLSRTDRLRFLRTYLAWGLAGKDGWKDWWREIDQAARAKAARNVRLGRVIG